jgi:hypothetical protein
LLKGVETMKYLAMTVLTLLVACAAFAGGNPSVVTYVDFDPPNMLHYITPDPYTSIDAYICFGDLDMGLTSASFRLTDPMTECPGAFGLASFTNILPGDLAIGNIYTGITLSSTGCEAPPIVCVGYLTVFYLAGGECCIEVLDHPDYPRWITDCNDPAQVDFYGIMDGGGGAINTPNPCPVVPVEETTWGSVKALYR